MTTIEERLAALEARVAKLESAPKAATSAATVDVNLDGEHGDPVVRKDPPKWNGESCVGKRFSECPPAFLQSLAGFLRWKAGKNDADGKEKYAKYDRLDAARADGWRARIESGWKPAATHAAEAARYGTSGHGASAKHAVTPEPVPFETDDLIDGGEDFPFAIDMTLTRSLRP